MGESLEENCSQLTSNKEGGGGMWTLRGFVHGAWALLSSASLWEGGCLMHKELVAEMVECLGALLAEGSGGGELDGVGEEELGEVLDVDLACVGLVVGRRAALGDGMSGVGGLCPHGPEGGGLEVGVGGAKVLDLDCGVGDFGDLRDLPAGVGGLADCDHLVNRGRVF